uniref:Uncharacterized protein n=1 Tax=Arundo donax TaxID=35708 RepID=A0A0A9PT35_ARUDO
MVKCVKNLFRGKKYTIHIKYVKRIFKEKKYTIHHTCNQAASGIQFLEFEAFFFSYTPFVA